MKVECNCEWEWVQQEEGLTLVRIEFRPECFYHSVKATIDAL